MARICALRGHGRYYNICYNHICYNPMSDSSSRGVLRSNWFHILAALADRDLHGSAIARDVLGQTDGAVRLWPATLYRTLDDMVAEGLVLQLEDKDRPDGESARRQYYEATRHGRAELAAAAKRMAAAARTARQRLRRAKA